MIYLDNAATSFPKPEPVYQALDRFARTSLANPGRAGHRMAVAAERMLDAARHSLNQFFRGVAPERWIFTLNCTDGLNLAIKGIIRSNNHVITTDLEHNSISRPLVALQKAGVISLTRVASDRGYVDPEAIKQAITPQTSLVAMTHASNVLGTVQPIEAIAAIVCESEALLLVDASQSAGVVSIDLESTPIDLLAFPGH
jgi:cysteine desulfurase/selenocysteine lyase